MDRQCKGSSNLRLQNKWSVNLRLHREQPNPPRLEADEKIGELNLNGGNFGEGLEEEEEEWEELEVDEKFEEKI